MALNEDCNADGSDAIAMYENMAEGELRLSMSRPYCGTCEASTLALGTTGSFRMIELNEAVHKHGVHHRSVVSYRPSSAGSDFDGLL